MFGKTNSVRLFDSGSACVLQSSQMAPSIAAWKGRELTTEAASTVLIFFSLSVLMGAKTLLLLNTPLILMFLYKILLKLTPELEN